ncbi:Nucleoside-diphosphate-sugar epimerase [Xylanibacter ruminicola]|uniref:Nucleoside-diphosphate-sugar epimerase n=1 Tax=Xylanibacter ruminicola TaxID=839 RepID=A0A1H5RUE6_XYLRU|nr:MULTISPECIES: SDR family oxidoreductase [Prevotellaceae]MCR5469914.1 SDR family oxidoreductase [Prevotella sp.]SEF41338.1 Nucleoside-diphosphate-sugar epimerase [Xylanibacter ruminicola]SEW11154.1 Nucleoside-diphosphate-sugar epimerase [Prevotella sp. khp7]
MKILLIGGTGTISSAITRQLATSGHDLWLLNRGNRKDDVPAGVRQVICDINNEAEVLRQIGGTMFDAVCEFIGFLPSQVERDIRLFKGRTRQYVYISSASAYNKPARNHIITEGTSLANPYWQYSRDKIACEELLMKEYRENGFPVTIVRPSHTYCERAIPVSVHGPKGSWQVLKRMIEGKAVLVQGDGSSLWTLTWNEDFAKGFIGLLGNPKAIGEPFQIMSDESLTWNQIYQCVADALKVEFKPYYVASQFLAAVAPKEYDFTGNLLGDKSTTVVFDCSKLKHAVPGYQATTRFDEGVRRCVAYILAHPELQIEDPEFDAWCDRVIEAQEKAKAI